tara:strand:+ start:4208 stop:5131 length:924 start_codon:yes stop_codon:yes gene_type:complete
MRSLSDKEKFLTITPYFGGISEAPRQTDLSKVLRYFVDTYNNLTDKSSQFIVSVANDKDYSDITNLGFDVEVLYIKDINPIFLPANTCREIQKRNITQEYVWYTEADQLLYCKDIDFVLDMINENHNVCVMPQRFCQIPNEIIQRRRERYKDRNEDHISRYPEFDGIDKENNNKYCIECAPWSLATSMSMFANTSKVSSFSGTWDVDKYKWFFDNYGNDAYNGRYYINVINDESYGAAYLCHRDLFNKVSYVDSQWQPTEHTGGHDILAQPDSICIKSVDYKEFFIDHLSGYDFNKKLLGEDWATAR